MKLPAAGLNAFNPGVFSFILFNSALTQFLNLEISALEADGKGKTISSPRVLTADGVGTAVRSDDGPHFFEDSRAYLLDTARS